MVDQRPIHRLATAHRSFRCFDPGRGAAAHPGCQRRDPRAGAVGHHWQRRVGASHGLGGGGVDGRVSAGGLMG